MTKCISCDRETHDGIRLACPKCQKAIVRCPKCRSLAKEYKCTCKHEGP